ASSVTTRSTVTAERLRGWHSGINDGVCLAPMIPASRATANVSPLGTPAPRSNAMTASETSTRPLATAVRAVTDLWETSTIRAAPVSSTCVRPAVGPSDWLSSDWLIDSEVLVQAQHLDHLAGGDAGALLRHHDQGVGRSQVTDLVRPVAPD